MIESISKLDAATRQLDLAILLYFRDDDPLGALTVTGAAHGMLSDLLVKGGGTVRAPVAPSSEYLHRMAREAKNFLKHADRDAGGVLKFNPDWTDFLIFETIGLHIRVARTLLASAGMFLIWLSVKYPDLRLLEQNFLPGPMLDELRRLMPRFGEGARKDPFLKALVSPGKVTPDSAEIN